MSGPIYWVLGPTPGRIGLMARPRGQDWLEDDIRFLARSGVTVLVSLLTDSEQEELGLSDESSYCVQQQISYFCFPIPDRQTPALNECTFSFIRTLRSLLKAQNSIVIHCRMGIGRASLIAASTLLGFGVSVEQAFEAIAHARGCSVPDTPEQRNWVKQFSDHAGSP